MPTSGIKFAWGTLCWIAVSVIGEGLLYDCLFCACFHMAKKMFCIVLHKQFQRYNKSCVIFVMQCPSDVAQILLMFSNRPTHAVTFYWHREILLIHNRTIKVWIENHSNEFWPIHYWQFVCESIFVWVISAIYVNTPQKLVRKRSQPTCVCFELHCDKLKQRFLTAEPVSAMSESITTQKPCIHFTRPSQISTRHGMHTPAVFIFWGMLLYNWPVNMHSKNMFVVPADPFLFFTNFTNILKRKQWSWIFWCIHCNIFWQSWLQGTYWVCWKSSPYLCVAWKAWEICLPYPKIVAIYILCSRYYQTL